MTTIKLYDHIASIHAQYARVVLDEAGVEYEKEFVALPLGNLEPSYAKVSPVLSVPALEISSTNNSCSKRTLTDSRDIINFCAKSEGGKRLFPEEKMNEINEIIDLVYHANGGQISFQAYPPRDPLFDLVLNKIVGPRRTKAVKRYLADPEIVNSPHLKKVYDAASERMDRPGPSLDELSQRANKAMSFLHNKLEDGPWLLGKDHTAADCVAAIWVQWILWADVPSITVTPRVLDCLCLAKQRPAWEKTQPVWVISYVRTRIYAATALLACAIMGMAYLFGKKFYQ